MDCATGYRSRCPFNLFYRWCYNRIFWNEASKQNILPIYCTKWAKYFVWTPHLRKFYRKVTSSNSLYSVCTALPELPIHKHMTQKEEWCSVAKGSLRIFIDSKPPWSSSSTPIKDFGRKSGWKQGRVGLITKKYDVQTIEWLQHKHCRCLSYKVT